MHEWVNGLETELDVHTKNSFLWNRMFVCLFSTGHGFSVKHITLIYTYFQCLISIIPFLMKALQSVLVACRLPVYLSPEVSISPWGGTKLHLWDIWW